MPVPETLFCAVSLPSYRGCASSAARLKARDGAIASEAGLREQNGELRRRLDGLRVVRDELLMARLPGSTY
jgi:hypothetical protein